MKTMLALSLLLVGSLSFADSVKSCVPKAQVLAKITSVEHKEFIGCTVYVSLSSISSIKIFNASSDCPLQLDEVLSSGIEVGLKNGHDCDVDASGMIDGILMKTDDGKIVVDET